MGGDAEALIPRFQLERVLNQDQAGRRISLLGTIDSKPALLQLERAPFPTSQSFLSHLPTSLARLSNIQHNDIYAWYSGLSSPSSADIDAPEAPGFHADLKINLMWPCTEAQIAKYSVQTVRYVTETPEIYRDVIRPYIAAKRAGASLNWVYNILEGTKEAEDVLFRTPLGEVENPEGFLLMPDLNWDRTSILALHLLCLVERRDIWTLRDLKKSHIPWLEMIQEALLDATTAKYPEVERDQIKMYVHYQPTYYHLHIHVVHVAFEPGATQAVGKAVGLGSIIETLKIMGGNQGEDPGMDKVAMSYGVGEASELWQKVWTPLKEQNKI